MGGGVFVGNGRLLGEVDEMETSQRGWEEILVLRSVERSIYIKIEFSSKSWCWQTPKVPR